MTNDRPRLRISETILKTARISELRLWYRCVLDTNPTIEHMPEGGDSFADGTPRASGMRLCFFELNEEYPYTQTIGIFEIPGTSRVIAADSPGLHHMQLHCGTMSALVERYEALTAQEIRPARSMNHGISISFYYTDPDGNTVELTANNFATLREHRDYLASPTFRSNPSGVMIDPEDFRRRYRTGEPVEQLRVFPA